MPRFLHISYPSELTVRVSVGLPFVFLILSVFSVVEIANNKDRSEIESRVAKLRNEFIFHECQKCFAKNEDIAECKKCDGIQKKYKAMGGKFQADLPKQCLTDKDVERYIEQISRNQLNKVSKKWKTGRKVNIREKNVYKRNPLDINPGRFIVHWMLMGSHTDSTDSEWQIIKSCERHRSTYSVSSGPQKTFHNGGIKVPQDGVYSIYVKLTFACQKADYENKRIFMEMVKNQEQTLMRDVQMGNCSVKSDLITMYQQGVFRLQEGDVIHARYKTPANVFLPTNPYQGFKSNIGVIQL